MKFLLDAITRNKISIIHKNGIWEARLPKGNKICIGYSAIMAEAVELAITNPTAIVKK